MNTYRLWVQVDTIMISHSKHGTLVRVVSLISRQQADAPSLWRWRLLCRRIPSLVNELLFSRFPVFAFAAVRCLEVEVAQASFDAR